MFFIILPFFFIALVCATGVHPPPPQPSHGPGNYICPPTCSPGRVLISVNVVAITGVTICTYKSSKGLLGLGLGDETICTYFTNTGLNIVGDILNGITQGCPKSLQKSYNSARRSVALDHVQALQARSTDALAKAEGNRAGRTERFAKRLHSRLEDGSN